MKNQIDKSNPNAWSAPREEGYSPVFINTKVRRGNGLGSAFGKGVLMEDILNPPSKKIPREEDDHLIQEKACHLYGAGDHINHIDMRVNSVTNRDMCTRFAQFFLFPIYILSYLVFRIVGGMDWFDFDIFDYSFLAAILSLILYDFFRPIATPVRFNHKDQEVYAFHKGSLYRIPWNECEIACMYAPDYTEITGTADAYSLNLWLYPKNCVNGKVNKAPVPLVLLNEGPYHGEIYNYWEYIRAFMENGTDEVYTLKDKQSRAKINLKKTSMLAKPFSFFIITFVLFLHKPASLYLWLNPFKKKWPKEVHEWTGETINWH